MKILHLISQAPDFTGSGKYLQAMIRCAKAKGHDNFLVAGVQDRFVLDPELIPSDRCRFVYFKGEDLPYPLPGMSDAMPYENTIFSEMSCEALDAYEAVFRRTLLDAIHQFQPDIIHSHHLWLVTVLACDVAPWLPVVTTCHGTCLRQYTLCPDIRPKVGGACRRICRVIALSEFQKREIEAVHGISPDQIDVIPGGYDDTIFFLPDVNPNWNPGKSARPGYSANPENPGISWKGRAFGSGKGRTFREDTVEITDEAETKTSGRRIEILYAGKLCRAKGVPWLLQALRRIDTHRYSWRLHLAGSGTGEEKAHCLRLAEGLGSNVVVHGPLSHTDLGTLMRQCDLFVLPSFFEGLPLVLMEALACGCRVLTTALPGTREVLGQKTETYPDHLVTLIELPPLETVDRPFDKDLPLLEERLSGALEKLMAMIMAERHVPDAKDFHRLTLPYSWEKIFHRVEGVYRKALLSSSGACPE